MSGPWSLIVHYWKALGITVPASIGALVWIHGKYKALRQRRLDSKVLDAFGNHVWTGNRPFIGMTGDVCVRASEIAEVLRKHRELVADSLERLELQGKVGRSEADSPPYWFIVRR